MSPEELKDRDQGWIWNIPPLPPSETPFVLMDRMISQLIMESVGVPASVYLGD